MSRLPLAAALVLALACSHAQRPEPFDAPDAAEAFYVMKRTAAPGADPHALYDAARAHMANMPLYATNGDRLAPRIRGEAKLLAGTDEAGPAVGSWAFLGPGNIGGRTRVLVFDPTDPSVMWTGGVSGGVWKSTDAGEHWSPVGDLLQNLAVNSMVIDPNDRNTLYVGTGEGYFREDVRGTELPLRGDGIYVTRNGGGTWSPLPATRGNDDFRWVNDLVMSRHDSRRLYAATRTGVWRTTDAGEHWTRIHPVTVKGGCLDLALRPDTDGDYLFASCGIFEQATVYRSKNAEGSGAWETVLREPAMSRTSLAISPSRPSTIYALAARNTTGNTDQTMLGVYRSDQNGDFGTWTARVRFDDPQKFNTILLTNPITALQPQCSGTQGNAVGVPMGWHCNVIAVDPTSPERVWAAGVDLFRSDDGGRNWGAASYWWPDTGTPAFVHADQHAIVFHPRYDGATNRTMFATNDGGIYRTDDATAPVGVGIEGICKEFSSRMVFRSLNNSYGVTQFYHGMPFPDGHFFIGGAQDNGTLLGRVRGVDDWEWTWGGDGAFVAIDPVTPNIVYTESQFGNMAKSNDAGHHFQPVTSPPGDSFLFVTPFVIDPSFHDRVWIGGRRLWRSDNGTTKWDSASAFVPGSISAIAVAPGNSDRVLAGTTTGVIVRSDVATTTTAQTTWATSQPRIGWVSWIAHDPTNIQRVYATYAGFGGTHVWKSLDGGTNWLPLDGSGDGALPDIPVHSIAVDPTRPSRLYLGTDLGIFVSTDSGATWAVENTGFAAVVTETVIIGQGERGPAVYAFTHGRGAWRAELTTPARRRGR